MSDQHAESVSAKSVLQGLAADLAAEVAEFENACEDCEGRFSTEGALRMHRTWRHPEHSDGADDGS